MKCPKANAVFALSGTFSEAQIKQKFVTATAARSLGAKIGASSGLQTSFFVTSAKKEFKPGEKRVVGQNGRKLVVYTYEFDGLPGGHNHPVRAYNGGLPKEFRARDGEFKTFVIGDACGTITETITEYPYKAEPRIGGGQANIVAAHLTFIGESPYYHLIGYRIFHKMNHYGRPIVLQMLRAIAREYYEETGSKLHYNDMSLPWGGLFDTKLSWEPPHHEHRNGTVIDIAATPETMTHEEAFRKIVRRYTTDFSPHGTGNARHYHVRFNGREKSKRRGRR